MSGPKRRRRSKLLRPETVAMLGFVTDTQLRDGLRKDYEELQSALEHGLWKSVHVLTGSIFEAVACDFLSTCGSQAKTQSDPSKLDFAKLVEGCREEGALSEKAVNLSTALRHYRNLIHPGRAIRLKEGVDEKSATVAASVLDICVEEISMRKRQVYGYTADQVLRKLQVDSASLNILPHLLDEMHDQERERLVERIPFAYAGDATANQSSLVVKAFHLTFDSLSVEAKRRIVNTEVKLIREGAEQIVVPYQNVFFRISHLEFMEERDKPIVKKHLLSRLSGKASSALLRTVEGFENYLKPDECQTYVDFLVRVIIWEQGDRSKEASRVLIASFSKLTSEQQPIYHARLCDWENHFKKQNSPTFLEKIKSLRMQLTSAMALKSFGDAVMAIAASFDKKK